MQSSGPICVVDDEQSIRETLEAVLKDEGYEVVSCPTAESFQQKLKELTPSLVLLRRLTASLSYSLRFVFII